MFFSSFISCFFLLLLTSEWYQSVDMTALVHTDTLKVEQNRDLETLKKELFEKEKLFYKLADEIWTLRSNLGYEKILNLCLESAREVFSKQEKNLRETLWKKMRTRLRTEKSKSSLAARDLSTRLKLLEDMSIDTDELQYTSADKRIFQIVNTINSTFKEDNKPSTPHGIVTLNQEGGNTVVVTDYNNKCVKSFWYDPFKDREYRSRLTVVCYYNIAKLSEKQVVVGCWYSPKIQIINVNPSLSLHSTIKTPENNQGLRAMVSPTENFLKKRILTGHENGLSVINLKGELVKTMDMDITGRNYTKIPRFLTLTPAGNVIISDNERSLVCISLNRTVLWRYNQESSVGVTSDAQGNVYVAVYLYNKVILLSPEGKFIKNVLTSSDHLKDPNDVFYDSSTRRLYIAEYYTGLIKIYEHQH